MHFKTACDNILRMTDICVAVVQIWNPDFRAVLPSPVPPESLPRLCRMLAASTLEDSLIAHYLPFTEPREALRQLSLHHGLPDPGG